MSLALKDCEVFYHLKSWNLGNFGQYFKDIIKWTDFKKSFSQLRCVRIGINNDAPVEFIRLNGTQDEKINNIL